MRKSTVSSFDRRSQLVEALRAEGRLSTRDLCRRFGVSEVTIRHDLSLLERQGWLQRVHGGAEIAQSPLPEMSFGERRSLHAREKHRLALAARDLLADGDTILLDNSTSAYQLALLLREGRPQPARVITNSFPAAAALATCAGIEVIILGGVVRGDTLSVVGAFMAQALGQMRADWLFMGAGGLSIERGLSDADIREVEAKQAMIRSARRVAALVDSSKLGRDSFLTVAPLSALAALLTDAVPPAPIAEAVSAQGIRLILV